MDNDAMGLFRSTDPDTSGDAAFGAASKNPDGKCGLVVLGIMADGVDRTDDEIYLAYHDALHIEPLSDSRLRHGRKYLIDTGQLFVVGRRRMSTGGIGRVYCINKPKSQRPAPTTPRR